MKKQTNASSVYDIAKILTVLLVVLAHSARMYTPHGAFSPIMDSPLWAYTAEFIYLFHMPLFMFLSGAVYGLCIGQGKYGNPIAFLRNKAKRLLIPYFLFGFFYVAPVMVLTGLAEEGYLAYCLQGILLSMNSRHLWFLAALFLIFAVSVLVRKRLLQSHRDRALVLLLSGAVYLISRFAPAQFQIQSAARYQLFFMMGAVFHIYYENLAAILMKFRHLWGLLLILLIGSDFLASGMILHIVRSTIGILMLISLSVLLENRSSLADNKWFRCIKDNAMGIYLFHPMIIYLCFYCWAEEPIPPTVLCLGSAIGATILSILLTGLLRKLRLGFLMGESRHVHTPR